jgi:glycosyltransferase involved in cell wall biosynthesis
MRVLLVIHRLFPSGGAERQLVHLALGLSRCGYAVTICCVDRNVSGTALFEEAGIEVVELCASSRVGRLLAIPRIARLAQRADVVHCTMWDASLWGRLAAIIAGRPVIVADHATDRAVQLSASGAPRADWIARHNRLLDRRTFATVACASTQLELLKREGVAESKLVHIPNGVPLEDIRRQAQATLSRSDLGIPKDAKLLMHVGVFRVEKNQAASLEIVRRLREHLGDVRLVFVGSGRRRGEIEQRAREMGADWALFLGLREDVPALLSLADLMILPSLSDAMPMTLLEAMALGVPVVASAVGDVPALLRHGGGICVAPGDVDAFVDACLELLTDEPRRMEAGARGRDAAGSFDSGVMIRRYAALFEAARTGASPHAVAARWD